MNILIDYLPSHVNIGGSDFKIKNDFRTSILFEQLIFDNSIEDKEKISLALELYFPNDFKKLNNTNIGEAIEQMLWFFSCGKDSNNSKKKTSSKVKRIYECNQ